MVRVKRRYLTLEIVPEDPKWFKKQQRFPLNERELIHILRNNVQEVHGDYGFGSVQKSLYVKKFCPETRIAVITIQRGQHVLLTSSIPLIKEVNGVKCMIRTLYFSGTLRSSLKHLTKYYRKQSLEYVKILADMKKELDRGDGDEPDPPVL